MKRNALYVLIFFVLLIVVLIFTAAHQARRGEATATPLPWLPPQLSPDPAQPTQKSGWWGDMPTAIPFPTPTQRN